MANSNRETRSHRCRQGLARIELSMTAPDIHLDTALKSQRLGAGSHAPSPIIRGNKGTGGRDQASLVKPMEPAKVATACAERPSGRSRTTTAKAHWAQFTSEK